MLEAAGKFFSEAKYQHCTVHFYQLMSKMLKAIHTQENKKSSEEKAKTVVEELRAMKLKETVKKIEDDVEETLTYCDFLFEY